MRCEWSTKFLMNLKIVKEREIGGLSQIFHVVYQHDLSLVKDKKKLRVQQLIQINHL